MENKSQVEMINLEINRELANEAVGRALLATTFKGLTPVLMKQAITEGMIRGFKFKDFLEKNVYAIPFKEGYSLITSIDFSRKIGMRSGIVGKKAPVYEFSEDGNKIVSCTVTVLKRDPSGYIGEFTATTYFDEYYKGGGKYPSLWDSKPRTMIAKVAEMHALRMACPEELSQQYIEEEMELENKPSRISEVLPLVENNNLKMDNFLKENGKEKKESTKSKDEGVESTEGEHSEGSK
jgi:hypothetical protein